MMKSLRTLAYLVGLLSILSATGQAQNLVTGNLSASFICPPGTLTVPFSATGPFGTGNTFTAQLSDVSGSFTGTVTPIGSITANPTSATTVSITATIPKTTPVGAVYKVRVISSVGSKTSVSATILAIGTAAPSPPATAPVFCQNSSPASLSAVGQSLKWYTANSTVTAATLPVSTTASGVFSVSVTQTVNGCESVQTPVSYTVTAKAASPTLLTPAYCATNPPTSLSVTGTNLQWFTNSAGTATASPPVPLTVTQTIYVQQTNASGCKSDITALTVTVNPQPPLPAVTPSVTICSGTTATLSATPLSGNTLRWFGSNPQGVATTQPVATTAAGPQYVSQVNSSGCESDKAQITVVVNPLPVMPAITMPAPICSGDVAPTLSATATIAGATLRWYASPSTPNTFSTTAPVPANTTSSTYYVAQADPTGCVGALAAVVVTVKKRPGLPLLSAAQNPVGLCQNVVAQALSASLTDGTSLNWYVPGSTAAVSTAPVPPTSGTGTAIYKISQVLNGCEGPLASLTVTVNAIPPMPAVVAAGPVCQGSAPLSLSATGMALKWYGTNATGGNPASTQVTDNSTAGLIPYYVSQTVNGCESPRNSLTVQVKSTPGMPGTAPLDFCQNTTAPVLTATTLSGATPVWYGTNPNGPSSTTPPTIANTNSTTLIYYVSQLLDGCEGPKATLAVRVKPTPGAPGTAPIAFCNNSPAQTLTASGQNLTWYDQNDNLLNGAPTPPTGSVGTQVYKVTQTVESCVSAKSTLTVTVNALPAAPGTSNLQYCLPTQDQPAQSVGPLTAGGQSLKWYNPDGNQYSQPPVPPISQTSVITFQVTQTINNCESPKANLQVTIQTTPAPITPKPLVTYCRNDVATPLEATGTNLRWIDPNNNLLPANTTPTPPTLNATLQGVFYQVYQTGSNGCVSPRASIRVIVNTNPTLAVTGSTQVNLGQTAPLQLHFTGAPPFSYTLSGGTTGTALSDTSVLVIPRQTTTYQVVNVANVCGNGLPGNPASAVVTVNIPTITTGNLNSSTLCAGSTFTVPYSTAGDFNLDLGYQVQLVPVADTSARSAIVLNPMGTASNPIPVVIPGTTPGGTYFVRIVRSVLTSPLIQVVGSNSPTRLTIRPLPAATLSGSQNIYEGSPTNLTIAFGGDGPWSFVYTDSVRTFTGTATTTPYLLMVQPLRTTTYRLSTVNNNCGSGAVSGTAVVTVLPLLGVEKDPLSEVVKAYPVPATSRLTVAIDRPLYTESALLELVDLQGRTTLQQTTRSKETELDLSGQPAGQYVLRITLGDKQTTRKILKQ